MNLSDILEQTKDSLIISDAFTKADSVLNHKEYKNRCETGKEIIRDWLDKNAGGKKRK